VKKSEDKERLGMYMRLNRLIQTKRLVLGGRGAIMRHRKSGDHFANIHLIALALFFPTVVINGYAGPITVRGTVTASAQPVRFASITFVNTDDTTNKYVAVTDTSGNYTLTLVTSVRGKDNRPAKFELEQNYPNPFSSLTSLSYKLNERSDVSIRIYDITGREVKTFKTDAQDPWHSRHCLGWYE
jgi:hypothetical protein